MVGIGLTLEGIHTNWITNEALLSQGWQWFEGELDAWVAEFAHRRYSSQHAGIGTAWAHLANFSEVSVYNGPRGEYFSSWGNTRSLVTRRPFWASGSATGWGPGTNDGDSAGFMGDAPRYNPKQLMKALRALLAAAKAEPTLQQSRSLRVDVIDLSATMMANLWILQITKLIRTTNGTMTTDSVLAVEKLASQMIKGIAATDVLLGSDPNYLLGSWITDAKSWATNKQASALLEFNARNQVTLWGPPLFVLNKQHTATNPGNPQDYAGKTWAGLFSSYYQPRQQLFVSMLQDAVGKAAAQQNGGGSVCHGL